VFGWAVRRKDSYIPALADGRSLALPTLWEELSSRGIRVGVIGFPLTYPAREVNGFWFPGLLSPPGAEGHPPGIVRETLARVPGWRSTPREWSPGTDPEAWTGSLVESVRNQAEAALYLARKFRPQVLGIHFQATDTVQHYLWGSELPARVFQAADKELGRLIDVLSPELVIVMSDHGMGPAEGEFHINTWLWREGFLTLRRRPGSSVRRVLFRLGWSPRGLERPAWLAYRVLSRLGLMHSWADVVGAEGFWSRLIRWGFLSLSDVDWRRTWAYSHSEIGSIFVNRADREPQGRATPADIPRIVRELRQALSELTTPAGERLIDQVYLGEEIYQGPYAPLAPDILFLPAGIRWMGKGLGGFLSRHVFTPAAVKGSHRMEGILLLSGEGVRGGAAPEGAELMDIAPTVLAYLGQPIPSWMDGRPLSEVFREGVLVAERRQAAPGRRQVYGEETVERLKGLGYL
jgi:predicted AlkP superfamily phosphohydrolase/phosphomutase